MDSRKQRLKRLAAQGDPQAAEALRRLDPVGVMRYATGSRDDVRYEERPQEGRRAIVVSKAPGAYLAVTRTVVRWGEWTRNDGYTVTHIPTGFAIKSLIPRRKDAILLMEMLERLGHRWDFTLAADAKPLVDDVKAIFKEWDDHLNRLKLI